MVASANGKDRKDEVLADGFAEKEPHASKLRKDSCGREENPSAVIRCTIFAIYNVLLFCCTRNASSNNRQFLTSQYL